MPSTLITAATCQASRLFAETCRGAPPLGYHHCLLGMWHQCAHLTRIGQPQLSDPPIMGDLRGLGHRYIGHGQNL